VPSVQTCGLSANSSANASESSSTHSLIDVLVSSRHLFGGEALSFVTGHLSLVACPWSMVIGPLSPVSRVAAPPLAEVSQDSYRYQPAPDAAKSSVFAPAATVGEVASALYAPPRGSCAREARMVIIIEQPFEL
jgi:hypothetical protein